MPEKTKAPDRPRPARTPARERPEAATPDRLVQEPAQSRLPQRGLPSDVAGPMGGNGRLLQQVQQAAGNRAMGQLLGPGENGKGTGGAPPPADGTPGEVAAASIGAERPLEAGDLGEPSLAGREEAGPVATRAGMEPEEAASGEPLAMAAQATGARSGGTGRPEEQVEREAPARTETGALVTGRSVGAGETAQAEPAVAGAPPEETAAPEVDPRQAIAPATAAVRSRAAGARRHPPAAAPVASAQAAALNPETEQTRSAAAQTVEYLDEAKANEVERQAFKARLRQAVKAATPEPKTEAQANEVMNTGAQKASQAMSGELEAQRDTAAGPIRAAATTEVLPSEQPAPPQTELRVEQVGPAPAPVLAAPVVPAPLPPERLDYSADRAPADQLMAQNEVTTEQLHEGNDPAFGPTLEARTVAEQHEAEAEGRYRESESEVESQAQQTAQESLAQGLGGFQSERAARIGQVGEQQRSTQSKDAAKRQQITNTINRIKNSTQADVNTILDAMERDATSVFEEGLQRAERAYEDAFKEAKGGLGTWLTTWGSAWDRHIESALRTARERYLREVDTAIDQVADVVGSKLAEARRRVAEGRRQLEDYVKGLDESVRDFGEEALKAVSADFDAMESQINQRRDALINNLVQQYRASYDRMSAMEQKLRDENKSLWQRVYDATVGVIEKIIEFKNMLLSLLARVAGVVRDIIAHPIRFLGNLIKGVKLGLDNFVSNIGLHLQKALLSWLFGTLAEAGIQLPESFDMKGILSLVLQVLGLTYSNIRKRAVNILGEELVSRLEQVAEIFKILITEGPGGLWEYIKDKLSDLKNQVIEGVKSFVVESVITAGIKWVIGLLNPASAFIKACMAIYDIIKFFIERGSQIIDLINAIVDSLASIVSGNISAAAKLVEDALAKALPVVIGFLASLLGLGDVSAKIRSVIETIQEPVNAAIDWVIHQAVKLVKAAGKLFGIGQEEPAAKEEVPETDDPEHDAKVLAGLAAIDTEEQRYVEAGEISYENARVVAETVKEEHSVFRSITVVDGGDSWDYRYAASPVDVYDTTVSKLEGRGEPKDPEEAAIEREAGQEFDRSQQSTYPANQVKLRNGKILDSYVPGRFIISRKRTQITEISQSTWERYLNEFDDKYAPGEVIADVPAARKNYPHLIGEALSGQYVLEVSVQRDPVIDDIELRNERLSLAERRGIVVRDYTGFVYRSNG